MSSEIDTRRCRGVEPDDVADVEDVWRAWVNAVGDAEERRSRAAALAKAIVERRLTLTSEQRKAAGSFAHETGFLKQLLAAVLSPQDASVSLRRVTALVAVRTEAVTIAAVGGPAKGAAHWRRKAELSLAPAAVRAARVKSLKQKKKSKASKAQTKKAKKKKARKVD